MRIFAGCLRETWKQGQTTMHGVVDDSNFRWLLLRKLLSKASHKKNLQVKQSWQSILLGSCFIFYVVWCSDQHPRVKLRPAWASYWWNGLLEYTRWK